ncbi:MAG TPA: hypothetical protein VFA42_00895 [Gaiellaceae bacterium]|nr:hypothetical protein [Gaiellaceae bacterium]
MRFDSRHELIVWAAALAAVAAVALTTTTAAAGTPYRTARNAAATAPRCFSNATRTLKIQRRPLPSLPLPDHLKRDPALTRLYLVTYLLLKADAVDKPGRHDVFAYVARPNEHALWHLAACGTGP